MHGAEPLIPREIQAGIEAIEKGESLGEETNFVDRAEAIDYLEFHIINRIECALRSRVQPEGLTELKQRAELLKVGLERVNENLFRKLRVNIRSGNYTREGLRRQFCEYAELASKERLEDDVGYDALDVFVSGLLWIGHAPEETREKEPDMVFFQPTPARIVLELIEQTGITEDDVFYDLGAGLGHVPILVSLLSGARAKGIEFEPAYCDYAQRCARRLNLPHVEFVSLDARDADYSDGTIFYMYTPFEGELLQEVLEKLKGESRERAIRVCTYGPCTAYVSRQSWLRCIHHNPDREYELALFRSV